MPRKPLSPEARRRISEAAKRRWASYRAAKPAGRGPGRPSGSWTPAKRAAQSRKIRAALARRNSGRGPIARVAAAVMGDFTGVATDVLISTRRRIDQELADRLIRGDA
jgi:hypothetical protein